MIENHNSKSQRDESAASNVNWAVGEGDSRGRKSVSSIRNHKIIGAAYCPYCRKVKKYFEDKKIPFTYIDTETAEGDKIRE
ncbi:unnamed protein product [Sphagnum balticum]